MAPIDERIAQGLALHPGTRVARLVSHFSIALLVLFAVSFVALFSLHTQMPPPPMGPLALLFGSALLAGWWSIAARRSVRTAVIANLALKSFTAGRLEEAEAIHSRIPASAQRRGPNARALSVQRTMIAWERADHAAVVEHATAAIRVRRGFLTATQEKIHCLDAKALRAAAHASLGHELEATQDADDVETSPLASARAIAQASLARGIVLGRRGDHAGLAHHLSRDAVLLFEQLPPGDRSLVRALREMARSGGARNPYRDPALRPEVSDPTPLTARLEAVAPGAAHYVPAPGLFVASSEDGARLPAGVEPAAIRARSALGPGGARGPWPVPRPVILWIVLVVSFLGVWQFLQPKPQTVAQSFHHAGPHAARLGSPAADTALWLWPFALGVTFSAGAVFFGRRTQQKQVLCLLSALAQVARGHEGNGREALLGLAKSAAPIMAARAQLELAHLSERRADWEAVLVASDAGLAHAVSFSSNRVATADFIEPGLLMMRALALGASGRAAAADSARALLDRDYPSYALAAYAHFRVRLVAAVHTGDLQGAAEVARTRTPGLPLTIREDLLCDVVLGATGALPEVERQRIAADLRDDAKSCAWIDAIGPEARRAFDAA